MFFFFKKEVFYVFIYILNCQFEDPILICTNHIWVTSYMYFFMCNKFQVA